MDQQGCVAVLVAGAEEVVVLVKVQEPFTDTNTVLQSRL